MPEFPSIPAASNPDPADPVEPAPKAVLLSRRAILRQGGLLVGGIGAAAVVAGCSAAGNPNWTFAAAPLVTPGQASSPSPAPVASAPVASAPAPSATAAPAASPSGSPAVVGHDPSPADFAVPKPFRPALKVPVEFSLTANDGPAETIIISASPLQTYQSMNFDHQVPAPTLRITEGDTVHFTLTNQGQLGHSIDFHAAQTAWSKNYQEVPPGTSASFSWTADYPGVFMYHCGTVPVLMHIGDGMYGAIVVDPKAGRAAAREYVIVQSEFYGTGGDYAKMLNSPPDYVVLNGQANRYKTAPLPAKAGELVRLFVVNAGPNSSSAFHVIGALFSKVEASGYPANAQGMHQTLAIPPGDGALLELRFAEPGDYPFVTHKFSDATKGATGVFHVT
ncbi:MAG: multicopper oxidase domain-containing protein [Candidatus Limnocylindrales bacterium]